MNVKVNFIKCNLIFNNIYKKLIFSTIIFSIVIYMVSNQLMKFSSNNNLYINIWDGIFRILNHEYLIVGCYMPFIIIVTTFFNGKSDYLKFMLLRINKKSTYIISKLIMNTIVSFFFTITLFSLLLIINLLLLKVDFGWSSTIVSKESLKIVYYLYPNIFVYDFSPIQSFGISFLEILIGTIIVLNLRELCVNYIKTRYVSYILIISYLFFNILGMGYALNGGIFKINQYIGLDRISILYKHNFDNSSDFSTTVLSSMIISIIYLLLTILINYIFKRRLAIEND